MLRRRQATSGRSLQLRARLAGTKRPPIFRAGARRVTKRPAADDAPGAALWSAWSPGTAGPASNTQHSAWPPAGLLLWPVPWRPAAAESRDGLVRGELSVTAEADWLGYQMLHIPPASPVECFSMLCGEQASPLAWCPADCSLTSILRQTPKGVCWCPTAL